MPLPVTKCISLCDCDQVLCVNLLIIRFYQWAMFAEVSGSSQDGGRLGGEVDLLQSGGKPFCLPLPLHGGGRRLQGVTSQAGEGSSQ